jgi:hypothetical protein
MLFFFLRSCLDVYTEGMGASINTLFYLLGSLAILLILIGSFFIIIEIGDNTMIKKNTVIKTKIEIPYKQVTRIYRTLWIFSYIYTIEAEVDSRKKQIHLNIFSEWRKILKAVASKVDSRIIDDDVLYVMNKIN